MHKPGLCHTKASEINCEVKSQTSAVFQGAQLPATSYSSPPAANDTASQSGGVPPALCHQPGPVLHPADRGNCSFIMKEQHFGDTWELYQSKANHTSGEKFLFAR